MNITKPDTLALTMRLDEHANGTGLHLGFLCGFSFDRQAPMLSQRVLWALLRDAQSHGLADAGFPKPGAEVLVCGRAAAPQGAGAGDHAPSIRIGNLFGRIGTLQDTQHCRDASQPRASSRRAQWGTFDPNWLSTRWPQPPIDLDPRVYFNAPDGHDQSRPFQGDEPIEIRNMHPCHPVQRTRLPGVRLRCWIRRAHRAHWESIAGAADTLWLFPTFSAGILLHRAHIADAIADPPDRMIANWTPLTGRSPKPDDIHPKE